MPPEQSENQQQTQPTIGTALEHWWEASVLTTVPSLLPGICKGDPQRIHIRDRIKLRDNYKILALRLKTEINAGRLINKIRYIKLPI